MFRGVARRGKDSMMPWAPKSPNNVASTFFSTVKLLPKDLRFEHGGVELDSYPGRAPSNLGTPLCMSQQLFSVVKLQSHLFSCRWKAACMTCRFGVVLKVLPSPKRDNKAQGFATNDAGEKTTKMGFATKFAAQKINPETSSDKENEDLLKTPVTENAAQQSKSDSCGDKSTSLVSPETAQFKANRTNVSSSNGWRTQEGKIAGESNDLDVLTANTLFIRADNGSSLSKPIGLCGKLVGITGTLQRSKTSPHILNGYSSLRRRAKSSKASILDDFFNKDEVASCEPDRSSHSSLRDQDPPDSRRRSAETQVFLAIDFFAKLCRKQATTRLCLSCQKIRPTMDARKVSIETTDAFTKKGKLVIGRRQQTACMRVFFIKQQNVRLCVELPARLFPLPCDCLFLDLQGF